MCLGSNRANIGEQNKFPGDSLAWKAEAPAQHGLMAAKATQAEERRAEPRMGTGTRRKMGTEDISFSARMEQDALQALSGAQQFWAAHFLMDKCHRLYHSQI